MYRLSNYNYEIIDGDRILYFNGISAHSFSVSLDENIFLKEQLADLISFEIQYPSFFAKLKEWYFVIDESANELDVIRYRNRTGVFLDKAYRLIINPTLDCNFHCWYCLQQHPKGYMSAETLQKVKNHIRYMIEEVKITSLQLDWFGGEPLLYFYEIIYPLAQYGKDVAEVNGIPFVQNITTNASLIDEKMTYAMKEIGLASFQITIDGDEKRHDKVRNANGQPSFRRIMNNINLLCQIIPDAHINLRLNYDDQTLEKCDMQAVFNQIAKTYRANITPMFVRVWQTAKQDMPQNEKRLELHEYCTKLGYQTKIPSTGFSFGQRTHCYADRYFHAELNYDGAVFKCTAQGHTKEREAGVLLDDGRIDWKKGLFERMYGRATFENEMCLKCKHLPICMGPCVQKILAFSDIDLSEKCVLKTEEITPEAFILSMCHRMNKVATS